MGAAIMENRSACKNGSALVYLTEQQVKERGERIVQELLHVDWDEGLRRYQNGELEGTRAGIEIASTLHLLDGK